MKISTVLFVVVWILFCLYLWLTKDMSGFIEMGNLIYIVLILLGIMLGILIHVTESSDKKRKKSFYKRNRQKQYSTPVPVSLTTGIWVCGEDIVPGRYTATTHGEYGGLAIEGSRSIRNIFGGTFGCPSVTFSIKEGDTIEITYLKAVDFEPVHKKN